MSGLLGSTFGIGRSPPPISITGRASSVIRVHDAPASSDRKKPIPLPLMYSLGSVVFTTAYSRRGLLGATSTSTCERFAGSPFLSCVHVLPPSVDLNRPPPVPANSLL